MIEKNTTICIANDHAGYGLKLEVLEYLNKKYKNKVHNFGTDNDLSCDYPDYAHKLAKNISKNKNSFGVLLCGSGNGIAITANKHKNVRAAICWNLKITELARLHNNANVLVLPARFLSKKEAIEIVDVFFSTSFEGGRHQKRVDKISSFE